MTGQLARAESPWDGPRGIDAMIGSWRGEKFWKSIALEHKTDAKEQDLVPFPESLPRDVVLALQARGFSGIYRHQRDAYDAALQGKHVVIATPTASGKSLCYNLPILKALADHTASRALYLFPTKALARDQEHNVRQLCADAGLLHPVCSYDGDTPADARRNARQNSRLLLSNPDMLHTGILPHHASWARFFADLRYVVIDELHSYRGVFGSHLANVIRRLRRVARFHGSDPVFMLASATIGNPQEHASRMIGSPVTLVDQSGAPQGPRTVLLYNPPVINAELGLRASYVKSAVRIARDLIRAGVSTLVFGQSRNNVEMMLKYLRDRAIKDRMDPDMIHGYRGGYLPQARRRIENDLRDGKIRCVVATNALELGIDIGSLDAVVCAGYPGSVAALWQRFGRGGRRQEHSLAILVTSSAPLDQYFALQPAELVGAPIEHARIDPDNMEILIQHLKCAAFELPFSEGDGFGSLNVENTKHALDFLIGHRVLHGSVNSKGHRMVHWASEGYPANNVSLRSIGWDNVVIIDVEKNKTFAEMDFRSAHTMLHEQAIYQHAGQQFEVERFDVDEHKAYVRQVIPDYFTDAMTYVRVQVIDDVGAVREPPGSLLESPCSLRVGLGEVSVVEKVVGYKKIKYHTHENVGYGDVRLPEMQMHTTAVWFGFPESLWLPLALPRPSVVDGICGVAHAMHTVASVGLMTDPRDIGYTVIDEQGSATMPVFEPTAYLYDHIPGGIGLAPRLFEDRHELLRRTHHLILYCPCRAGCPACVGAIIEKPVAENSQSAGAGRKHIARMLLECIL